MQTLQLVVVVKQVTVCTDMLYARMDAAQHGKLHDYAWLLQGSLSRSLIVDICSAAMGTKKVKQASTATLLNCCCFKSTPPHIIAEGVRDGPAGAPSGCAEAG